MTDHLHSRYASISVSPSSVLRSAARESAQADLLADSLQAGRVEAGEPEIELSAPPSGEIRYVRADPRRYGRIDLGAVAVTVDR